MEVHVIPLTRKRQELSRDRKQISGSLGLKKVGLQLSGIIKMFYIFIGVVVA